MYPQDPPPYPGQPGQQPPQPPHPQFSKDSSPQYPPYPPDSPYPQDSLPQYPAPFPAQHPPAQSYPPYPAEAPPQYPTYPPYPSGPQPYPSGAQHYPGPPPAYPGYGYQQPPHQPPRGRTEFGWASIIVATIALLTSPIPYFNIVTLLAATVLVLAGWLGKHERSRIPAGFGTGIAVLALISTVLFTVLWRDIFRGLFGL